MASAIEPGRSPSPREKLNGQVEARDLFDGDLAAGDGGFRPLAPGQVAMSTGVCTSGRGVEMVLSVAGAGKTTAIDVVRAGFETAGYRVIGTSISGQAVRTLGAEARIAESRTTASCCGGSTMASSAWTPAP